MHEKVKHLFGQKTQRQNKLPLPLLSLLLQILFNVNFNIRIFELNFSEVTLVMYFSDVILVMQL